MNNPLAFPTTAWDPERQFMVREEGMELRDYFAAKAVQGMLATLGEVRGEPFWDVIATDSYKMADAMLKVRES